jgi:hypothetical protein
MRTRARRGDGENERSVGAGRVREVNQSTESIALEKRKSAARNPGIGSERKRNSEEYWDAKRPTNKARMQ